MSITDELRHNIKGAEQLYGRDLSILTAIADRIDAERETTELQKESYRLDLKAANIAVGEAYKRGFDEGFASADDWLGQHEDAMAEHGWIRLPKDADGEYVHIGDVMAYEDNTKPMVVVALVPPAVFLTEYGPRFADMCRHHHAPTVEDVLTEFGIDWEHESDCEDRAALLKEYASKLRLAEGEGA